MDSTTPIKILANPDAAPPAGARPVPGCEQVVPGGFVGANVPGTADGPGMAFRGAMRFKSEAGAPWTYIANGGHLGELDCPEGMSRIRGHNIFSRTEMPVKMRSC